MKIPIILTLLLCSQLVAVGQRSNKNNAHALFEPGKGTTRKMYLLCKEAPSENEKALVQRFLLHHNTGREIVHNVYFKPGASVFIALVKGGQDNNSSRIFYMPAETASRLLKSEGGKTLRDSLVNAASTKGSVVASMQTGGDVIVLLNEDALSAPHRKKEVPLLNITPASDELFALRIEPGILKGGPRFTH